MVKIICQNLPVVKLAAIITFTIQQFDHKIKGVPQRKAGDDITE